MFYMSHDTFLPLLWRHPTCTCCLHIFSLKCISKTHCGTRVTWHSVIKCVPVSHPVFSLKHMQVGWYYIGWIRVEYICTCALQNNGVMAKLTQEEISTWAEDKKITFSEYWPNHGCFFFFLSKWPTYVRTRWSYPILPWFLYTCPWHISTQCLLLTDGL